MPEIKTYTMFKKILAFFHIDTKREKKVNPRVLYEIVYYAAGLCSDPLVASRQIKELNEIASNPPVDIEAAYTGKYLEIEKYLTEEDPAHTCTKEDVHDRIRKKFNLDAVEDSIGILFATTDMQKLKFAILILNEIVRREQAILSEDVLRAIITPETSGSPLEGITISGNRIDF